MSLLKHFSLLFSSNWVFENNHIFDNNRINDATPGSFQSFLPNGIGILMVGIRGEIVQNNIIEGNDKAGFAMVGFCTVETPVFGRDDCQPRDGDPSANFNSIIKNKFDSNGIEGIPDLGLPGADIIYLQSRQEFLGIPNKNCFQNNTDLDGKQPASFFATDLTGTIPLPTAGCSNTGVSSLPLSF